MPSFNRMVGRFSSRKDSDLSELKLQRRLPSLPKWLQLPMLKSFNFILYHYIYLIVMTIIGSIMIYPAGGMPYVDALFFACGAATQSGLNTIDLNNMLLYQQIVLIVFACLCNPITINSFVVFVRLYWFEKRFQHIVRTAKSTLKTRTRTRTKSDEKQLPDLGQLEQGVGGRPIRIFRLDSNSGNNNNNSSNNAAIVDDNQELEMPASPPPQAIASPTLRREIMFADEMNRGRDKDKEKQKDREKEKDEKEREEDDLDNEERVPQQRPKDQHIAFVEKQRNPKDNTALRIPGPRDFERGDLPEMVVKDSNQEYFSLSRRASIASHDFDAEKLKAHQRANADDPSSPSTIRNYRDKLTSGISRRNPFHRNTSPVSLRDRAHRVHAFLGRTLSNNNEHHDPLPYLSYAATIGRNSTFVDLTEDQREELGGIEYRSLKTLAVVLLGYNIGFMIFGIIVMVPWIVRSDQYSQVVRNVAQTPGWWGVFTSMSMFTDLGFTITPDSMISFQRAALPLLLGTFLIIIGNTGFPIMLRFVIWLVSRLVPHGSGVWEELRFLLDHPRRCFTLLFPAKATRWLLGILILLNGIDLIFFIILDLKDPTVTSLPGIFQFLDGLFQAAATRTAGFSVVNLADLHPGIQVSYLIMMYISVFPIAISVRRTNVYEEKSLGIYGSPQEQDAEDDEEPEERSYVASHLRRQLSFDLWYIFLGLFIISIIEGGRIENVSEPGFTTFSVLFEIVSAYGTVGLSLGYPNTNASFSAQLKPLSKLIIMAMMLRGRHRGLPYALDRAILLPGEGLKTDKKRRASIVHLNDRAQMAAQEAAVTSIDNELRGRAKQRTNTQLGRIVRGALSAGPVTRKRTY